ncbi:MAG: 6-phosphogluconolactonase [Halioglobus sp.]|nr:6-phosphogluconolactonase [Halioglobus sp.]
MLPRIHSFVSSDLLTHELCSRIATMAAQCLARQGYFSIILAGGETPRELYRQLRYIATDWRYWHIYFSDERCLPVGNLQRNDTMAATTWLNYVAIPHAQIHSVPARTNVNTEAADYAAILQHAPGFDLALLGLGEDGHTASLFPGGEADEHSMALAVAVTDAPKLPTRRVSMSPRCLSSSSAVWFIVRGSNKRKALEAWLGGAPLPPQAIKPHTGVDIFTDVDLEGNFTGS